MAPGMQHQISGVVQLAQNDVDWRRDALLTVHDYDVMPLPLRMGLSETGHANALS